MQPDLQPENSRFIGLRGQKPVQSLRGKGLGRVTLLSVSGGGLTPGTTKNYIVELKEGEYLYSCPLNPTPDYRLVVKG